MPSYRLDSIADLARQMRFTPHDVLTAQLNHAEDLLFDLDRAKAYPLDYVTFRITGYRPKRVKSDLLTGIALEHDLSVLIEQLSDELKLNVAQIAQPVLAIDDVTRKFDVTSKTIQRWRRRGLPARRFTFADGKRRVGFLLSSVERYIKIGQNEPNFPCVSADCSPAASAQLLAAAGRMAERGLSLSVICRRLARKRRRTPLGVEHTLRKLVSETPESRLMESIRPELSADELAAIRSAESENQTVKEIAARFDLPRAMIHSALLEQRLQRLTARKVRFIDDELYHQPDALKVIQQLVNQRSLSDSPSGSDVRAPRDLPPYLSALYRVPLLSVSQERALFLKFNYHKYRFAASLRKIDPTLATWRQLQTLEAHLADATAVKNQIVQANLRLVVSIARKQLRPGLNLMELISDGNISLMRAVDSFDVHRGFRFSTYATLAVMKGFARSVPQMIGQLVKGTVNEVEPTDAQHPNRLAQILHRDHVGQLLLRLDDRARDIVAGHFGLHAGSEPASYDELADRFGLTKSRVRQIEAEALAQLRDVPFR